MTSQTTIDPLSATPEDKVALYEKMRTIRVFEERVATLVEGGEIRTPCHLAIGQEAIAAGVCQALTAEDTLWGGHRSHGHYLAKGGSLRGLMAEIFARETGCSRGRGGSMHLAALEVGILGTVPLVAATIPLAVGAALASHLRGETRVAVSFFGDGAVEEGHFHESLNLAAVYRLPVLFVCENNFYASHMALLQRRAKDNILDAAQTHGVAGERMDGNDAVLVLEKAREAVQRARRGEGPTLLECRTYRWRGHVGPSWDMDVGVQRKDELKEWLDRDPIKKIKNDLLSIPGFPERLADFDNALEKQVEEAVVHARSSSRPLAENVGQALFHSGEARSIPCA